MSDGETPADGGAPRPPDERKPKALPDIDYEIVFPADAEKRMRAVRGEAGAEQTAPVETASDGAASVGGEDAPSHDLDTDEGAAGTEPAFARRPDARPKPIIVRAKGEARVIGNARPGDPLAVPDEDAGDPDAAASDAREADAQASTPAPTDFERPGGPLSRYDAHLVMYHDPHSLQAEQYRTCRTNLTALNKSGAPWTIVVTSSKEGEGKSVTASNLAVCLAELPGARVCLLDTDFRAPTQGAVFGIESPVGLHELLTGAASWKEAVRPTGIPALDVIVAGSEPPNSAELLGGPLFSDLLEELGRRYTWILVDTPPVNPFTDACVVSTRANGTLVVVRLQETPRELVTRTIDALTTAGGRVFGTFLTGVVPDRDDAERQEYYRVEGESGDDAERRRQRQKLERKLRRQERAWLKKRQKKERADQETV
ncbi:MAG: polysaccharide biosynthesis tyrosine autokinase [Planctomycetes bacterium]|nr:polysaccharide biosynthesis tyrosine autokinase [Planctomycetota bacterium]